MPYNNKRNAIKKLSIRTLKIMPRFQHRSAQKNSMPVLSHIPSDTRSPPANHHPHSPPVFTRPHQKSSPLLQAPQLLTRLAKKQQLDTCVASEIMVTSHMITHSKSIVLHYTHHSLECLHLHYKACKHCIALPSKSLHCSQQLLLPSVVISEHHICSSVKLVHLTTNTSRFPPTWSMT